MFLSLLPAAPFLLGADKTAVIPSEIRRYLDPATDFPIQRLTDPAHTSLLPAAYAQALSRRGNWMIFANDRTGAFQLYRMDLKSGQARQLTDLEEVEPSSGTLTADEKTMFCVAGRSVYQVNLANLRQREVYRISEGLTSAGGLGISEDGAYATLVEKRADTYRLRLVNIARNSASTVIESPDEIADPVPRPKRAGILYRSGTRELHVINFDRAQNQRLRIANGNLGTVLWSQDGRTVTYLNIPDDRKQFNNIREFTPDANEDRQVATTSQFVSFGRNADASMFVGASGSKASPYVLLLVRSVKRELTVCEHKASDPRQVSPRFSLSSQRIFFQSDRHGKWAIYSMQVERFVEETE